MTEEERLEEQRQFYIQRLMDGRSKARANLFMESALRKDINDMTPKELESLKYYRDYLVHNPNSFPPPPASPLRSDWDERQSIIGATNDMKRQSFRLKNELDDVPTDDMVMAGERMMDPIGSRYPSMDMSIPDEEGFEMSPIVPMGSPDTDLQNLAPPLQRSNDPVLDSDVFKIEQPLTRQIPQIASNVNPGEDFAMNPSRNDVLTTPAMSAQEQALAQSTRGIDVDAQGNLIPFRDSPTGMDFESENMVGQTLPMTAKADNWYDSFSKNFNKDASTDAFLIGSQLINTYDKDPLLGRDIGGGSLAGISQGALTGAGMGSQFGPKGALIGAGIGATAGLLGGFDRSSPEPYTETKIIRGAGMAFPQMQSSNYYQGLI